MCVYMYEILDTLKWIISAHPPHPPSSYAWKWGHIYLSTACHMSWLPIVELIKDANSSVTLYDHGVRVRNIHWGFWNNLYNYKFIILIWPFCGEKKNSIYFVTIIPKFSQQLSTKCWPIHQMWMEIMPRSEVGFYSFSLHSGHTSVIWPRGNSLG